MNQKNKDRILKIMNQVKKGLKTPKSAANLMIDAINLGYENGKADKELEHFSNAYINGYAKGHTDAMNNAKANILYRLSTKIPKYHILNFLDSYSQKNERLAAHNAINWLLAELEIDNPFKPNKRTNTHAKKNIVTSEMKR